MYIHIHIYISNDDLYQRCNSSPLRDRILTARWSLFGHVLRLARDTPAQLAMDYYAKQKGDRGRPVDTLPVLLFNQYRKYKVEKGDWGKNTRKCNTTVINELRELASDRQTWRELVAEIISIDVDDILVSV